MNTDGVEVGLAECISFLDKSLSLLNSGLKAEASVEVSGILVDGFEVDADSDVEMAAFDLLIKLDSMLDGIVTTYQIQLVDSSRH